MKNNAARFSLALALGVFAATSASAGDIALVATGAITHGGDDWQVARTGAGVPVLIHGGGRAAIGAGVLWQSDQYPLATSLLANYHVDQSAGVNGDAKFRRMPLDAMVYYTGMQALRVGVGLSYAIAPTVDVTVDHTAQTIKFDNATGKAFEVGYQVSPSLWANLRLVSTKYTPKQSGNAAAADVSHLAVNLSYVFK
ncbi:MAG: hypothetical protein QFF03_19590 [Pseudomonadota bacterium]|nr:hypothetical protein [Pseudomonadota bacterium]